MSVYDGSAVWLHSEQKGPRLLLLLCIADSIDKRYGNAQRTMQAIANRARIHERSVQRYNNDLIEAGELIIEPNPGYQSRYHIPLYPGEIGYAPASCTDDTHECNGWHSPIPVFREEILIESAKRRKAVNTRRYRRPDASALPDSKKRGGKIATPPKAAEGGGKITTPRRQNHHPPAAKSPPPGGDIAVTYPISDPNYTQGEPNAAFSWKTVWDWQRSTAGRAYIQAHYHGKGETPNSELPRLYREAHGLADDTPLR